MTQPPLPMAKRPHLLKEPVPRVHKISFWKIYIWPIAFLLVLLALLAPWAAWWQRPAQSLKITVLDKTVPDRSFRKHKGLYWILEHEKIQKPDGSPYRFDQDYAGFEPFANQTWRLREGNLSAPADLVYVADTYGVYTDDFHGVNPGARPTLIHGGLQMEELDRLKRSVAQGGTFIAEFNTFCSNNDTARDAICSWLGVKWSGWMGRHFDELRKGAGVPLWAVRNYEKQNHREYNFTGPGFMLCSDKEQVIILDDAQQGGTQLCQIHFGEKAQSQLKVKGAFSYVNWFDISSPEKGTEVLAEYTLDLKPSGVDQLKQHGLPVRFPAIFHRKDRLSHLYYFAGDFLDCPQYPWLVRYRGLVKMKSYFYNTKDERFYWVAYVPMMQALLDQASANKSRL